MLPEVLVRARGILEDLTPLKTDCGLTCQGACCRPMEGEMTGMLLFPGEEAYYEGREGYRMTDTEQGTLLICSGRCDRADRPLSCRLMPLLPLIREDGVKVATDFRAKAVCPLARQGKDALDPDFVSAVREAGRILAEDQDQRAFLVKLTRQQDELKALRNQFRRGIHV
nr:hypothetical protein [Clostridia bacterium]